MIFPLLLAAASIDGLPIGVLPAQALPARGCAAYLFATTGEKRAFVAMAGADPATLRIAIDGATADLPRATQDGEARFGLAASTVYRGGDTTATLDLTIGTRGDLTAGAVVPEATLRLDRPGKDTIVLPLAGLIGCAT